MAYLYPSKYLSMLRPSSRQKSDVQPMATEIYFLFTGQMLLFLAVELRPTETRDVTNPVALHLYVHNLEVLGSNFHSDSGYSYQRFTWFPSVHLAKWQQSS
jgi:hypothetical protein